MGYVWAKYEQDILAYESEWYLLSFAYSWLGDKTTKVKSLPDYKGYSKNKEDDSKLSKDLWELFNEADIIVGHNSNDFDIKKANTRFIYHDLSPVKPYKTVDTLKMARKYFKFNSNKLGDLGKYLGLGEKKETGGFATWLGCMEGNKKAWSKMTQYNKQDVELLKKIYLRVRPWIATHPDLREIGEDEKCPKCHSNKVQKRGFEVTRISRYQRLQCQNCFSWFRNKIKNER